MKKSFSVIAILLFCAMLVLPGEVRASSETKPLGKESTGIKLAQTLSMITGVAISPLLGVGTVGAWTYFEAPKEHRANLSWYAQPWFWIPALLLVAFVAAKDILGTAAPTALKKPFDIAEAIENKVSGLVAAGAFVPLAASVFGKEALGDGAMLSSLGFAAVDFSWLGNLITVPVAMLIFVFVFLLGHSIQVLIILSPFTTVDTALKSARLALLASVPATSYINPWFGALWALIIILVAYLVAGWTFRLSHFGTVFVWDYFTRRRIRFVPDKIENKLFLARAVNKVPIRTYGKLSRDKDGKLILKYRPWLVLPSRILELPEGRYEAGRGIFYSEILRVEGEDVKTMILLPPRYLGHEGQIADIYKFAGTRDVGLRAAWSWLRGAFGFRPRVQAA
jgi:hypothetical protein